MGILVRRFEDVHRAIEMVTPKGRLFCFFAIDDRPSHKEFYGLLDGCRDWIDNLSASSHIFSFVPVSQWSQLKHPPRFMFMERLRTNEESDFLSTFESEECYRNPSLVLARKFGITPRELPGIVFFKALPDSLPLHPLFIPLDLARLQDQTRLENTLAELFSSVQKAWDSNRELDSVLDWLRAHLPEVSKGIRAASEGASNFQGMLEEAENEANVERSDEEDFKYVRDDQRKGIKLFISYAREDHHDAEFLFSRFSAAGFVPWMDRHSILPGETWDNAIQRALKTCEFFVACLSTRSVQKRGYLQREFRFALDK